VPQVEPDERTVYLSTRIAGNVGGVAVTTSDIVAYDPDSDAWSLYFDGSDVGFISDIWAFSLLGDGSILLTPRVRTNLPGVGVVEPHDIVRFSPSSVGDNTAGAYSWFLDGSDVGLAGDGEVLTGISFTPAGRLVVSTFNTAALPGVGGSSFTAGANDLSLFVPNSFGSGSSGFWEPYLDGDAIGLSGNRLSAHWIDPTTGDRCSTASPWARATLSNARRSTVAPSAPVPTPPSGGARITA